MRIQTKWLFSFVLSGMLVLTLPSLAKADTMVTYMGTTYDISTVQTSDVEGTAGITTTPWYGNVALSDALASLVGDSDAVNTAADSGEPTGPVFVINESGGDVSYAIDFGGTVVNTDLTTAYIDSLDGDYAVPGIVASPEPGTLSMMFAGLLGLGLLVGLRRGRENRLANDA